MTYRSGVLSDDLHLPPDLSVSTDRLQLIPGTSALADAEREDRRRFSELLSARVPDNWPPEIVPDPHAGGWWTWYFVARETPDQGPVLIGVGGLRGWPAVDGSLQMGCSFLPEFRGHGYGTEGVRAITRWALMQSNVKRVFAEICLDNKPAHEVLKKVGFVQVGEGSEDKLVRFRCELGLDERAPDLGM
jgi:RimJ/RimL family protein N-acetyltransferase